jgi:hypothetical protein
MSAGCEGPLTYGSKYQRLTLTSTRTDTSGCPEKENDCRTVTNEKYDLRFWGRKLITWSF